jgi:TonB family protein
MKKLIISIISILLLNQLYLSAQNLEIEKNNLIKQLGSNEKMIEFQIDLKPNETANYSLVLSKNGIFTFYFYQYESNQIMVKINTENDLNVEGGDILAQPGINKISFNCQKTGKYYVKVKNDSKTHLKSFFIIDIENKTLANETQAKTDSSDVRTSKQDEKILIEENVYLIVETMPKFGGKNSLSESSESFREFLQKNVVYPEEAKAKKIKGRVYVTFIVDKEGYIKSAKVIRGVHSALDQEALRVILSSPRWEPGKEKGKPVNVTFTMPIIFELN